MSDIIARIDALLANTPPSEIEEFEVCRCLRDAKAEIERIFRLVSRAADDLSDLQSENRSLRSERQELWRAMLAQAAKEVEAARLTDDERQAIQWVVGDALSVDGVSIQATLRGLLERTKLSESDI